MSFCRVDDFFKQRVSRDSLLATGLLLRRETSRTELFQSTAESANVMEEDRYDQLFIQANRRIIDNTESTTLPSPPTIRSNYSRNIVSRNFFDDV